MLTRQSPEELEASARAEIRAARETLEHPNGEPDDYEPMISAKAACFWLQDNTTEQWIDANGRPIYAKLHMRSTGKNGSHRFLSFQHPSWKDRRQYRISALINDCKILGIFNAGRCPHCGRKYTDA